MQQARVIETPRLVMRPHAIADFADSALMWSDPAVTRHIGGKPSTREEAWSRLLRYAGHWSIMGYGYWVARERVTGRFVGEIGFAELKRDMEPAIGDLPEMGWALAPVAQGKGYAIEAVLAALSWAERAWDEPATICMIAPDNGASLRLAAKVGFAETCRTHYKGSPTILLTRAACRGGVP